MDGVRTDYLSSIYNPTLFGHTSRKAMNLAKVALEKEKFDSIAFTGNSGAAIAYILAAELGVSLICLRKKTDNSHFVQCGGLVEGYLKAKRYLFVDDFITSGGTFRRLVSTLKAQIPEAQCVGLLLYDSSFRTDYLGIPAYTFSRCNFGDNEKQVTFRDWKGGSNYYLW